jgi:hypothetical protein
MARDLYGEMLSRALNRGAPPGHFPAYINPGEAAQLRAQGGGVPPGDPRGQYVANGLPSYQSTADWEAYAAMAEALGSSVEMPPAPERGDLPEFAPSRRDVAAAEVARLAALPQSAVAPVPVPAAPPASAVEAVEPASPRFAWPDTPPPSTLRQQPVTSFLEQQAARSREQAASPTQRLGVDIQFLPLEAAELAQRTAKAENAEDQIKQNLAVETVKDSYDYNAGTPEGEALIMAAIQANRLTHTNAELSALNFEVIINDGRLTPEEMASRLSANISEGGIGKHAPAAGAATRAVDRGYGEDRNLKDTLRSLTLLTPEGEYAVMGGGVSMPRELLAFGPALAGSAASFILPPAVGAAATLGPWALGMRSPLSGVLGWGEEKYGNNPLYQSVAGSPLGNLLGMRSGEERVLPEIDLANIRRMVGRGRTGGAPDVAMDEGELAERESAERESAERELDERELDDAGPFPPVQRPTDPISQAIQNRLRQNRELGEEQRRLAQALIPRQFA